MKKIIYQTLIVLILFNTMVTAQIINMDTNSPTESGIYYKDLDHRLDPYVGTWLYTEGNTSLRIKLVKKEHYLVETVHKSYYSDFIVGEFQYIENGNLVLDRIPLLDDTSINYFDYSITCFSIYKLNQFAPFPEANPLIRMLRASYHDPVKTFIDFLCVLAVNDEIENQKLIFFFKRMIGGSPGGVSLDPVFPTGKYFLSKVP